MLRNSSFNLAYRQWAWHFSALAITLLFVGGCSSLWPTKKDESESEQLEKLLKAPEPPDLVREAAVPIGLNPISVEGVAVVNGLPGTGGPADPSPLRDQLLEEMKRHDVKDPNQFLELPETALVQVKAMVPAGAQRGDAVDLFIMTPPRSKVSNLHTGWLMDTRLRHQQTIQNSVKKSDVMVIGTGPVLTRASLQGGDDDAHKVEGRIVGGGRIQIDRKLGLILRPEYQHVKMSAGLAAAINRRFFFFDGTTRRGIAKAVEDDYIEVDMHPRYQGQQARLMAIVGAVSVRPESSDTQESLLELGKRLREPSTAADAANQLEALGESAIPTLVEALETNNPELRFYAAEALAYLDREESIELLEEAIRNEPAFRYPGLAALEGLEKRDAVESLQRLFDQPSLETRYGAFCAMRRRADGRVTLAGKTIGNSFRIYKVNSESSPAVVVSTSETPEIVLFGSLSPIEIPDFLYGAENLLLKPEPTQPGYIRIVRFQLGKDDKRVLVPNSVDQVIAGIVTVGGEYGDVINTLRKAKDAGYLNDQLAFDPLPRSLRTYHRDDQHEEVESEEGDELTGNGLAAK